MNPDEIVQGVFSYLTTLAPFLSTSLQFDMPDQIGDQPALYFIVPVASYPPRRARGLPPKVTLDCQIWIFDKTVSDPRDQFGSGIRKHWGTLHAAFTPPPGFERVTLDGLVFDAWIEGDVLIDLGNTSGQGRLVVPLKILIP